MLEFSKNGIFNVFQWARSVKFASICKIKHRDFGSSQRERFIHLTPLYFDLSYGTCERYKSSRSLWLPNLWFVPNGICFYRNEIRLFIRWGGGSRAAEDVVVWGWRVFEITSKRFVTFCTRIGGGKKLREGCVLFYCGTVFSEPIKWVAPNVAKLIWK